MGNRMSARATATAVQRQMALFIEKCVFLDFCNDLIRGLSGSLALTLTRYLITPTINYTTPR